MAGTFGLGLGESVAMAGSSRLGLGPPVATAGSSRLASRVIVASGQSAAANLLCPDQCLSALGQVVFCQRQRGLGPHEEVLVPVDVVPGVIAFELYPRLTVAPTEVGGVG